MQSNKLKIYCVVFAVAYATACHPIHLSGKQVRDAASEFGVFDQFSDVLGGVVAFDWNGSRIRVRRDFDFRRKQKLEQRELHPTTLRDHFELAFIELGCNETDASICAEERLRRMDEFDIQVLEEDPELRSAVLRNLELRPSFRATENADSIGYLARVIGARVRSNSYSAWPKPAPGQPHRLRFSGGSCIGRIEIEQEAVMIELLESYGHQRRMTLREEGDGGFYFCFTHDNFLAELRQLPDGQTQLVWIDDNSVETVRKKSCFEVFSDSDSSGALKFLALLDKLGVVAPYSENDENVMETAVQSMQCLTRENRNQFARLLTKLDSTKYETRKLATEQLKTERLKWALLVHEELQNESISPEVRSRLREVEGEMMSGDILRFVIENQLLASPRFLLRILEKSNDPATRKLILGQLERETELNHGMDLEAWRKAALEFKK